MTKRAAQGRATHDQLIEVATRLFAEHGYEDTAIEEVLAAAGVSRGALYHHFAGKEALFAAVVQTLEDRILAELAELTRDAPDAVATLRTASLAWIDLASDPVIQQILLIDAPSVMGWEKWQAMNGDRALGAIRGIMTAIADEGRLKPEFADPFAHMILAAMDELALVIARADDPVAAREQGREAIAELLRRLTTP
ncbi:MAG TPA: helix-turn-helix domain-containing protein [Streptosporangiaceae bacterium]|nr:helix-turn-helix domain-containing protein [Streptosporangiaceae bacterium]